MSRRQILLSTGVLAIVTALVVAACLRSRKEPMWQGKTCSQWFAELQQAKSNFWIPVSVFPVRISGQSKVVFVTNFFATARLDRPDAWLHSPAAKAVRSLGTNVVPYLESEIRQEDSRWSQFYGRLYGKLPVPLRRIAPKPPASRDEIRMNAGVALSMLGSEARSAWPTLFRAAVTASPFARLSFEESLRKIPVEPVVLDESLAGLVRRGDMQTPVRMIGQFGVWNPNSVNILTNALLSATNVVVREMAAAELRYCQRYAPLMVPGLRVVLKDERNPVSVRQSVLELVEWIGSVATNALPELLDALKSTDPEMRYHAARAIESLGTWPPNTISAVAAATNDPNPMVQRVVSRILGGVDQKKNLTTDEH